MIKIKPFLISFLIAFFSWTSANAQTSHCANLGFELGNFDNWLCYNWLHANTLNESPILVGFPTPRRQEIMTDPTAKDPDTGNKLSKIPPGYHYSARLGDYYNHSDVDYDSNRRWNQSLRYTMTIDSTNALLVLKFAVVLEDPTSGHTEIQEPRFKLSLYNQNGDTIHDCANYDVYASNLNVTGFQNFFKPAYDPNKKTWSNLLVRWRDWTTVGVNLLKYVGQTITVEFMTGDCTLGGHGGHAYFVAECHPLYITVSYCRGDSVASLKAPQGMEKYRWTDKSGTVVDTTQILNLPNPTEGATYSCTMTSATGCTVVLQSTILRYDLKTDFTSHMLDCKANKVQIDNLSSTSHGNLLFNWDFGDGSTSFEQYPDHNFATSGRHTVTLIVTNPPSTCADTLTKTIESFSPPLVGISGDSTYCPGFGTWLKAYGAWNYTWGPNTTNADSIEVKAPGGKYWMLGHSSTGCVSDTIRRSVSQDPDWELLDQSDTTMCVGNLHSTLLVTGAAKYLWSTARDTTNSIVVTAPGTYFVTGSDMRGCKKTKSINVGEYPLPLADFKTSASVLDIHHNLLTCSIPAQTDVSYTWDMGDGLAETGAAIHHTYSITNDIRDYTISLTATSIYGCTQSASVTVDVVPFVPNVFSPNGDGINDLFMPDIDIQVFDRNGIILFKGTNGWDGTYKGRRMDPDTYFYFIRYKDRKQQEHTRKGFITLVR
jgi:gliding motility-associated-like protein